MYVHLIETDKSLSGTKVKDILKQKQLADRRKIAAAILAAEMLQESNG